MWRGSDAILRGRGFGVPDMHPWDLRLLEWCVRWASGLCDGCLGLFICAHIYGGAICGTGLSETDFHVTIAVGVGSGMV